MLRRQVALVNSARVVGSSDPGQDQVDAGHDVWVDCGYLENPFQPVDDLRVARREWTPPTSDPLGGSDVLVRMRAEERLCFQLVGQGSPS